MPNASVFGSFYSETYRNFHVSPLYLLSLSYLVGVAHHRSNKHAYSSMCLYCINAGIYRFQSHHHSRLKKHQLRSNLIIKISLQNVISRIDRWFGFFRIESFMIDHHNKFVILHEIRWAIISMYIYDRYHLALTSKLNLCVYFFDLGWRWRQTFASIK